MDLSKTYDCIPHHLIIAKLSAYGVDNLSLSFIHNHLSYRKQRVKINDCFVVLVQDQPNGCKFCKVPGHFYGIKTHFRVY